MLLLHIDRCWNSLGFRFLLSFSISIIILCAAMFYTKRKKNKQICNCTFMLISFLAKQLLPIQNNILYAVLCYIVYTAAIHLVSSSNVLHHLTSPIAISPIRINYTTIPWMNRFVVGFKWLSLQLYIYLSFEFSFIWSEARHATTNRMEHMIKKNLIAPKVC